MKKFLTVLLVIAVMFTFSFGSAFATTADEYEAYYAKVDAAERLVLNDLSTEYEKAIAETGTTVSDVLTSYTVSKAAFNAAIKAVYDDKVAAVKEHTTTVKAAYSDSATVNTLVSSWSTKWNVGTDDKAALIAAAKTNPSTGTQYADLAVVADFKEYKADELKKIALIDTDYDTQTRTIDVFGEEKETSYYELAKAEKERLAKAVEKITVADDATAAVAKDAKDDIFDAIHVKFSGVDYERYTEKVNEVGAKYYVLGHSTSNNMIFTYEGAFGALGLLTADEVAASDAQNAADEASALAALNAKSSALYADNLQKKANGTYTAQQFADKEEARAAFVTIFTDRIKNVGKTGYTATYSALGSAISSENLTAGANYVKNVDRVAEVEAAAKKYGAETDADGVLIRDAKAIEKVVKAAKAEAYDTPATEWTTVQRDAKITQIKDNCYATNQTLDFNKASQKAIWETAKADAEEDYYSQEYAKVVALYDEYIAKVDAVKSQTELDKLVSAFNTALGKIDNTTAVDNLIKATVNAELASGGAVYAYIEYKNFDKKDADKITNQMTNAEWYEFYAELGARDAKAVKALIDQAKAKVDTFVTNGALATEKAAVEAAIKALPTVITLANKDAVKAAWDANEAYTAKNGATPAYNVEVLNTAVAQLALIERKAIEKEINNLPAIVTVADKDAVKAVFEKAEAYNDLRATDSGDMYEGATPIDVSGLQTKLDKIRTLDKEAVEAAIDAIPLHVTEADKATVEAARKAFDAFVAEYENLEDDPYTAATVYNAYAQVANKAELLAAEDALKELINPDEAAKAYVQDLGIKARSTKTSKGVKVTIKADVQSLLDAGYTVEYKFYRSTKSNKNFGTAKVTKTTNTYLNTSGVKGTKYYYKAKLVVKNAAGEVVATTPLTQCLYATRTF